jgi:hypothetical protein
MKPNNSCAWDFASVGAPNNGLARRGQKRGFCVRRSGAIAVRIAARAIWPGTLTVFAVSGRSCRSTHCCSSERDASGYAGCVADRNILHGHLVDWRSRQNPDRDPSGD